MIKQKLRAVEMTEGEGAKVRRLFPTRRGLRHLDPFVLLDNFNVRPPSGFPDHPHRGFEAVTYMLKGAFQHTDNLGNQSTVGPGGVQRFTAGSGLIHSEMPGEEGENRGLQLWINLPRRLKRTEPDYQQVAPEDIPTWERGGVQGRTVIGEDSPVELKTDVTYEELRLDAGASYASRVPEGWSAFIYVIDGEAVVDGEALEGGDFVLLAPGEAVEVRSDAGGHLVFIAGLPHDEPIRQRGPFVD